MAEKNDDLGNRMKRFEQRGFSLSHIVPGDVWVARLDGQAFHTFTQGLKRPYDVDMSETMETVTRMLVNRFGADVGYTQSDEISLVFLANPGREIMYGGRVQKLIGSMSAYATAKFIRIFNQKKPGYIACEENEFGMDDPTFDCRIFTVPSNYEALNCLIWRQNDCTKNAISMAAQSMFKHGELQGKHGPEMQEMMHSVHGVNFNDFPAFFKRGTFARRMQRECTLSDAQLARMPKAIAEVKRGRTFIRNDVQSFDCWITKSGDYMEDRMREVFGIDSTHFTLKPPIL